MGLLTFFGMIMVGCAVVGLVLTLMGSALKQRRIAAFFGHMMIVIGVLYLLSAVLGLIVSRKGDVQMISLAQLQGVLLWDILFDLPRSFTALKYYAAHHFDALLLRGAMYIVLGYAMGKMHRHIVSKWINRSGISRGQKRGQLALVLVLTALWSVFASGLLMRWFTGLEDAWGYVRERYLFSVSTTDTLYFQSLWMYFIGALITFGWMKFWMSFSMAAEANAKVRRALVSLPLFLALDASTLYCTYGLGGFMIVVALICIILCVFGSVAGEVLNSDRYEYTQSDAFTLNSLRSMDDAQAEQKISPSEARQLRLKMMVNGVSMGDGDLYRKIDQIANS